MVETEIRNPSARQHRWSLSEKRRIVELTHGKGASISEIALAHGIHRTVLSRWRSLYRAGKLSDGLPRKRSSGTGAGATLLPVMISTRHQEEADVSQVTVSSTASSRTHEKAVIHMNLPSGATLRIETGSLDATFVCTLLAELRG